MDFTLAGETNIIAQASTKKHWFGETRSDAQSSYRHIVARGYALKCNYAVYLTPYKQNGLLREALKTLDGDSICSFEDTTFGILPIWMLATEVEYPIMNGETESAKVGNAQISRLTGSTNPEITITFLETAYADILANLIAIKRVQFYKDGTQPPPAEYAMWLTVQMFHRYDRSRVIREDTILVGLQTVGNLGLSASDHTPLTTTATFVQLSPYREYKYD